MSGLQISRLRTHKMRKLEGNSLIISGSFGSFEFHPKLIKFNG